MKNNNKNKKNQRKGSVYDANKRDAKDARRKLQNNVQ